MVLHGQQDIIISLPQSIWRDITAITWGVKLIKINYTVTVRHPLLVSNTVIIRIER